MIKPVTFQGCFNFNANLYALEVRSRFIDQSKANGYYKGYGNELAAQIVGQKIQIGTGAFLVQGRMCEITAAELVAPQIFDGFVGYVVARIETYHPSDDANCSLLAVVNRTYEAITLEQSDTYAATADNVNTAYELPLYSFEISGTSIVNLKKLINPVADYATIKTIVDEALEKAASAVAAANTAISAANTANTKSDDAVAKATDAVSKATNAVSAANAANTKSDNAVETANGAKTTAETVKGIAESADAKRETPKRWRRVRLLRRTEQKPKPRTPSAKRKRQSKPQTARIQKRIAQPKLQVRQTQSPTMRYQPRTRQNKPQATRQTLQVPQKRKSSKK